LITALYLALAQFLVAPKGDRFYHYTMPRMYRLPRILSRVPDGLGEEDSLIGA
jgi:hypothetical protein